MLQTNPSTGRFVFASSIAAESWRPGKDASAYEWWYFDALSDDGREAVIIVFLDNFAYSPRSSKPIKSNGVVREESLGFPAVSFTYFSEGKVVYRVEQEFSAEEFSAGDGPKCRIGSNGFRFESASYGSGFLVSVDLPLPKGRSLRANFEWLSVEADLLDDATDVSDNSHCWNMAVPRSDVSGKITVQDDRRRTSDIRSFRGTGYHDHNLDNHWLAGSVCEWHWGRAHFSYSTIIFCSYAEIGEGGRTSQLLIVRDGELCRMHAEIEELEHGRDKFGIRYPSRSRIVAEDGTVLETATIKMIDPSFHHLRFVSSMKVVTRGSEHSTVGITEFIAPQALRSGWLKWIDRLRNGSGRFFR